MRLVAIVDQIRVRSDNDTLTEEIWSHMPTKFSFILWRIKWGFLTIVVKHRDWGIQTQLNCLLCNSSEETINHLYANGTFTGLTLPDNQVEDIIDAYQKFTHYFPLWGLHWNVLCYLV